MMGKLKHIRNRNLGHRGAIISLEIGRVEAETASIVTIPWDEWLGLLSR